MARHPLHPMLVHFPVACWSLAVAADVASTWLGEPAWRWSSGLLAIGSALALVAMIAGLAELPRVPDGPALRDAWLHMALVLAALALFSTRLLLRLDHLQPLPPDAGALVLDAAGFLALVAGGWFGGRLVFRHGVGVTVAGAPGAGVPRPPTASRR